MTNNDDTFDASPYEGSNSPLVTDSPIELLALLSSGEISRLEAWKLLQLIHLEEIKCELPQYGTLTVFALAKDMTQFRELYDQGCALLRDNGIMKPETEEQAIKDIIKELKHQLGDDVKINITPINKTKKKKKKKDSGLGNNFNNRLN